MIGPKIEQEADLNLSENTINFWTFNRFFRYFAIVQLRNVEIFCEVANRRSFSKAAEIRHVAQSSASEAVHSLEKRLGTKLIDRSKRPLELTTAGRVYFDGCKKMLGSFRRVEERIRQIKNEVAGRVRVAAIYSVGLLQMDTYIKRFRALYPEVRVDLEYLHPDEVYARIHEDEAELGIVSFPRDGGEVRCIPWEEQEMILVVPRQHRLANRRLVSWGELDGEDYIAFTRELKIRRKVDQWLRHEKVSVNVVHEFDNIEVVKRAIEIGVGVAVLPQPTVKRELRRKVLRGIRMKPGIRYRPLGIVHRRHRSLSAAAAKFVGVLQDRPSQPPTGTLRPNSRNNGSKDERGGISRHMPGPGGNNR